MNLNATLIIEVISFLILMGLLAKFLYKPLLAFLDRRVQAISNLVEEAKRDREDARGELDRSREELHEAKQKALGIKEKAEQEAQELGKKVTRDAKARADAIIERSKEEIQKETERARLAIKGELAALSIKVAEKILRRQIKGKDRERLIERSVEEMVDER